MTQTSIPVAVTGMGCWYPGADSPVRLWTNILARRRQFRRLPDCRLPLADYHHADRRVADKTYARMAAVIDGFSFDWSARRIPRATYLTTDVSHWLALETALQAIADAGYTRTTLPGRRTGVIVGNSLTGEQSRSTNLRLRWPYVRNAFTRAARAHDLPPEAIQALETTLEADFKSAFPEVNEDTLAGGLSNTIAGRICNHLDLDGGGYTVDGACSSSLLAVITAAAGLSTGDWDLALAGGVDNSLDPFELVGFSKTGALTPGEMTVYDRRASGFIPGEGCGFVVLKRHADALRDGDEIYAVVRGWGISSDGGNAAITAPSVTGQSTALRRAYAKAGYGIDQVNFIEGHGTGTAVGDRVELDAISALMADPVPADSCPERPCGITSLKSIIGHTKAASGIGGFIKAVIAVNRRIYPPTAGCRYPNPVFEETARRLFPIRLGRHRTNDDPLKAGVSAMGFGGINTHVTLESGGPPSGKFAPPLDERALMVSAQENELFVLSAHTRHQLAERCRELAASAEGLSFAELTDLAAAMADRVDAGHALRVAFVSGHPEELVDRLHKLQAVIQDHPLKPGQTYRNPSERFWIGNPAGPPRIGFLFPGQGSQRLGMARVLVERFAWAREAMQAANRAAEACGAVPLEPILFPATDQAGDGGQTEAWFHRLSQTANAQPAICLASGLWCRYLQELGISPMAAGGHSLGEAAAFHAAGAFDLETLMRFAYRRGQAMGHNPDDGGAMLSLSCDRQHVERLLEIGAGGYVALANINAPDQMVVSGESAAIGRLGRLAKAEDIAVRRLPVSNAFHCRLTAPAAERLAEAKILPATLTTSPIRLFSGIDGRQVPVDLDLSAHFVRQVTAQVNFVALVEAMAACSDILIEVGPGRVLSGLVERILPDRKIPCLPTESAPDRTDDLNRLLAELFVRGQSIAWKALYANRLVNPFVPPADRTFIANPCENAPIGRPATVSAASAAPPSLPAVLAPHLADLPTEALQAYLKRRGEYLSEMIRVDMKHTAADAAVDPAAQPTASSAPTIAEAPPSDAHPAAESDTERLYALVEAITGFPRTTLTRDARLLDDLNLDSIKSGDLIARYAEQYGLTGDVDPAQWTNASLGEIVDLMAQRRATESTTGGGIKRRLPAAKVLSTLLDHLASLGDLAVAEMPGEAAVVRDLNIDAEQLRQVLTATLRTFDLDLNLDLEPLLDRNPAQIATIVARMANEGRGSDPLASIELPHTTVRELRIDVIESQRPALPVWYGKRKEDQWPNARVLILGDQVRDKVCRAIERQLVRMGAGVQIERFEAAQAADFRHTLGGFSHFIAVLPRLAVESDLTAKRLKQIIRRLSFAAVPPPASQGPRRRNCLVFVQFGGGYFGTRSDAMFLDQCCATALAKSVYLERDDLKTRVIDFDPRTDAGRIAEQTLLEIQGPENFLEVGYDRQLIRRTPVATAIEPALYQENSLSWSARDVILVTGGAKGITAACALALAGQVGAKMALIGRTPLPAPSSTPAGDEGIHALLERYAQQGLEARYYSCDVCDKDAVARTIHRIQADLGSITGVIHGAGQNRPRRFKQVSADEALAEVGPKVIGVLNLLSALRQHPPKLIVGLTSIIGITGMQGNGWYAFSNEALDLILRRFAATHPPARTLSVAYSIWRDEGMGARMGSVQTLKQKGIEAIPTDEGVKRFVRLFLSNPPSHQVLVTARIMQMDTIGVPSSSSLSGARFLRKRVHCIPGIESAFLVHLSLEEDLYLQDHCFDGAYLFPTVFGLEAMAQAVAHLTGVTGFQGLHLRDIRLRRPIVVDPQKGTDIVIWAQTRERTSAGEKLAVQTGIFKLGGDASSASFSATFVMGTLEIPPQQPLDVGQEALDLAPPADLYRHTLLFQGPRFQRIARVHRLERDGDAAGTAVLETRLPETPAAAMAFANPEHRTLLLGDPFQRDILLQSAALLIPQDTSLPMEIRRWDIYPRQEGADDHGRRLIETRLKGIQDQEVTTSVECLDPAGVPVERLSGYRLKVLRHHADYPTVADLLRPDERDTRLLQKRLAPLADRLRLKQPHLHIVYHPGLHDHPRDRRRNIETPLLTRAVEKWVQRTHRDPATIAIGWRPSGQPEAWVAEDRVALSLSHDERYCLIGVDDASLGCDLAPVTPRTRQEWRGLLGPFGKQIVEEPISTEELDRQGTALWAAREVLHKLDVRETIAVGFERPTDDSLLFLCTTDKGLIKVLTFWMTFTRGRERVVALSVVDAPVALATETAGGIDYPGYESLIDRRHYQIIPDGPQGQMMFVHRFPVTFRPAGQLGRQVGYANYFFWAGEVREASAWPVLKRIADQFSTGQWGGVTNYADLKIHGEATTHDLIEVRLWATGNGGRHNAVLDLTFDFRKVLPTGEYERLAWLEQQTTWVRILNHGVAQVEAYPPYYAAFVEAMLPRNDATNLPDPMVESLRVLHEAENESFLYQAPLGPTVNPLLHRQLVETSLEDANIVGNIYFANYYAWQGRVRDRYFFDLIPDYFQGTGEKGELICLNCRVDHLREAMPFDRIEVRMALKAMKACRATLHFEYFKIDPEGPLKLATGTQEVVWVRREAEGKPTPYPFPSAVRKAFETAIFTHQVN